MAHWNGKVQVNERQAVRGGDQPLTDVCAGQRNIRQDQEEDNKPAQEMKSIDSSHNKPNHMSKTPAWPRENILIWHDSTS